MTAYYNEIDPFAAAWLRSLISAGLIAPGDVDERSILDVPPDELRRYTQCHFFAGIGVWSYALRRAGWPDERPVWTGSCPCQPFSAAGKGGGFDDERHLWPAWHHLIAECRPDFIFGEQVASKDGLGWFDLVQADLEGTGYAAGAVDLCAAGVGAPHIRQRLWFVGERLEHTPSDGRDERGSEPGGRGFTGRRSDDGLADAEHPVRRPFRKHRENGCDREDQRWEKAHSVTGTRSEICELADAAHEQRDGAGDRRPFGWVEHSDSGTTGGLDDDDDTGLEGQRGRHSPESGRVAASGPATPAGESGGLADASHVCGSEVAQGDDAIDGEREADGWRAEQPSGHGAVGGACGGLHRAGSGAVRTAGNVAGVGRPGPTNGLWRDADWLFCRDGKWRPVEPGTFPLAHGAPARVGRLRGYGNAINAEAATAFITSYLESEADRRDFRLTVLPGPTTDATSQTDIFA